MSKLNVKTPSIFKYWAVGIFILAMTGALLYLALMFFLGFYGMVMTYGNVALFLVLTFMTSYAIAVPYVLGKIAFWVVGREILVETLEARA